MKGITTLLFDVDGTLLDTSEFLLKSTEHALMTMGYSVPDRPTISKVIGVPFPKFYTDLGAALEHTDELIEIHREFQYANYHLSKPFPDSLETLKTLKEKGYKIAAVTSRSNKTSIQTIKDAGMFEVFDTIVSFEDAHAQKPDPAPLFKALENLGEKPENAVMIGDSHLDIQAGKNAKTKTIRATYGFHKDHMGDPEPDHFIYEIKELLEIL